MLACCRHLTFTAILKSMSQLDDEARAVLRENDRGHYTIPTKNLYPFQWKWDSCFCAMGWHQFDPERAWIEIQSLFDHQWDTGMLSHIIFHENHDTYFPGPEVWAVPMQVQRSGITQPPVMASTIRALYEREDTNDPTTINRVDAFLPLLLRCHQWFHQHRDPKKSGLITIFHPWESGRDNNAEWESGLSRVSTENLMHYERVDLKLVESGQRPTKDQYDRFIAILQYMRDHAYSDEAMYDGAPFKFADVGINAILLRSNRDLLWLMERLDYPENDRKIVQAWIEIQETALQGLWNDKAGAFQSRDLITDRLSAKNSSASFLPLYAGAATKEQAERLAALFEHWTEHARFMVPSLAPSDPDFNPERYWLGPVWAIVNFMIAAGFKDYGYYEIAARIRNDTGQLIKRHGFMEYFNPVTGDGCGGDDFSWTAAMWLAWCNESAK